MIVHQLTDAPPADLALALARFEEQFTYPLGPGRSFRISHGEDYPRFFRAMGKTRCFVVEHEGVVLAVLGAAIRRLRRPNGSQADSVYLGDLKIRVTARNGYALLALAKAIEPWLRPRVSSGFGIVMEGTAITPERYTGKLGIPRFKPLAGVVVLRLPTEVTTDVWHGQACARGRLPVLVEQSDSLPANRAERRRVRAARESALFRKLAAGSYFCPSSKPAERSLIEPTWIVHPSGAAIGRLEDTRRAKRLIADDGAEMHSAHLACFAYRGVALGVELLHAARRTAGNLGFSAMFVAVPDRLVWRFVEDLACPGIVTAPATIYGTGIEPGGNWIVNTSEI